MNAPHFLRALSSRNYRLYFAGQCVSLLGNWMTATASLWLVYQLSDDPVYVGLIAFANQIPVLLLSPFAGVWIDRTDRLRAMQLMQALSMLQSAALAALTLTGHVTVASLLGLCLFQGFINAFEWPARQALTFDLVERKDHLDNVIALNSITFNLARLIGPAIAGFVIAGVGPGVCYALDAVSFVAVLAALFSLRLVPRPARRNGRHPLVDLREGLRYAWSVPSIRRTLVMVPVIALAGFVHTILAPVFARDVFLGDARLLGFLMAATGAGAVAGGLFLTVRSTCTPLARVVPAGALLGGLGLLVFAVTPWVSLAFLGLTAAGAGGVLVMASSNTLLQHQVPDEKRGRIMGLFTMGQGLYPVGSLLAGFGTAAIGPHLTVAICALICLLAALFYLHHLSTTIPRISAPAIPSDE